MSLSDQFAHGLGLSAETRDAVTLAASEAATNVVVHAYAEQDLPGTIEVSATVAMDELWVIITDTGLGLRPRLDSPGLGLGLAIIAQLADGVDLVRPSSGGLELRMRFALSGESRRLARQRGSVVSATRPASPIFCTTT